MFLKKKTTNYTKNCSNNVNEIEKLNAMISEAEAIVIGAGAGLSASAGLTYDGDRFNKLFPDFIEKYDLKDMYSSAFYLFETIEEFWAYFSKHIYYNRYESEVNSCYYNLLKLIENKNYFVITTNADHLFIKSGFDKERLFYTQGDYGLLQCSTPCHKKTYDNKDIIYKMVEEQRNFKIPLELVPKCPICGEIMDVNLRKDGNFVEDCGWNKALERYQSFLNDNINKNILFLELGIGYNTPAIIKYPFWRMTHQNENANYVCINSEKIDCPSEINNKSLCIKHDINEVFLKCLDK